MWAEIFTGPLVVWAFKFTYSFRLFKALQHHFLSPFHFGTSGLQPFKTLSWNSTGCKKYIQPHGQNTYYEYCKSYFIGVFRR